MFGQCFRKSPNNFRQSNLHLFFPNNFKLIHQVDLHWTDLIALQILTDICLSTTQTHARVQSHELVDNIIAANCHQNTHKSGSIIHLSCKHQMHLMCNLNFNFRCVYVIIRARGLHTNLFSKYNLFILLICHHI